MLYRRFGKTNEMVSALGFGCMRLPILPGGDPSQIDEELATKLIRHAIDEGVNYIDTAYPYHNKLSEPFVGKALENGYRQKVNLATKLTSRFARKREDMDLFLNEQLERLKTDHIDFYLIHNINKYTWPRLKQEGYADFLNGALKDGKIRYAGFSFHDKLDLFKEVVDDYDWTFCQIQYNYLDEEFQAGTKGLQYAAGKGLGISIMEPLRGGKLAGNLPVEAQEFIDKAKVKRTPAQWGLKWVLNHPEVSVVLSGMNSMDQVKENLQTACETEADSMTAEDLDLIERVRSIFKARVKVNCTACGYCLPCPQGVEIPTCFAMYNNYHLFGKEDSYNIWVSDKQRASNCIDCGKCESNCPQGIEIRKELKNVKEIFEQDAK